MSEQGKDNVMVSVIVTSGIFTALLGCYLAATGAATAIEKASQAKYEPSRIIAEGERAIKYATARQMDIATLALQWDVFWSGMWPVIMILILIILLILEIKRNQKFAYLADVMVKIAEAQ